ncbi:hypothetical protein [Avibacterium sp. 21-594]|nr:hypothetical protein [Avibacterium sp. 21-594]MCW9715938.1 hypothetical protein [Avibacterium sp. 21-594]
MLYEYQNFNAIAVHIPEHLDLSTGEKQLAQLKGVLQVNPSQMIQLH